MSIASARRVTSFRSLLFSGVAALALNTAALEARAEPQNFVDRPHWWLSLEGRALWATGASQPWAHHDPTPISFNLSDAFNETNRVTHAFSGKVTVGVRVNPVWDFALAYTGLRGSDHSASITEPQCRLVPIVSRYRSCYRTGTSQIRSTMHYGDFEAGYNVGLGAARVRVFGGARILHWRQSMETQFTPFGITDEERIARFFGAGPRIGAQAQHPLFAFGPGTFSVTGTVAGAVLFGNTHDEASSFSRQTTTRIETFYSRNTFSTVGNVEGKLGLEYQFANIPVSLAFGYHVEAFFGLVNTRTAPPPYTGLLAPFFNWSEHGTRHGNQFFHGPYFVFTARF